MVSSKSLDPDLAAPSPLLAASALSTEQQAQYARDGYLFLATVFSPAEVEVLRAAAAAAMVTRTERTVFEVDDRLVRSVYGVHREDAVLGDLGRHPRLVEPTRQLLGGDVYVYQSKLNRKAVFGGDVWPWHQDYIFWRNEDGMPAPSVLTVAVFLDEVNEANGPISFLRGSHVDGIVHHDTYDGSPQGYEGAPPWIANLVAKLKYTIERDTFVRLAIDHGVVAPKGPAGSVLLFDGNIAHASAQNLSPYDRTLALFTYNRCDNAPDPATLHRPDFLASRDTRPITPVADDALIRR